MLAILGLAIGAGVLLRMLSRGSGAAAAAPAGGVDFSNPLSNFDLSIGGLLGDQGSGETLLAQVQNLGGALAPRGIRNNNPGNIRRNGTSWQGMAPDQSTDPDFVVFTEARWGLRAIARIMLNKQARGLSTVRQLISGPGGWAPIGSADQNPASYADFIANELGVDVDQPIDLSADPGALGALVGGIVQFENGQQPYDPVYLANAVALA